MEELSKMNQINNLAFDIMHKEMNPTEQFVYAEKIYQLSLRPELNENQQVVLEALKVDQDGWDPFFTIWHMMENDEISNMPTKQQFQVLAAFAEWGMKEVSE
ncbi:hypothetical protein G15_1336 [Enterococcus avium]|nr:hypothetical protein G15_1336 [Enterococcus avium]